MFFEDISAGVSADVLTCPTRKKGLVMAKTPEERAETVLSEDLDWEDWSKSARKEAKNLIAAAIREAVEAERKRCSDLAKEGGEKISEYIDSGF